MFFKQCICNENCIWVPIQWTVPIRTMNCPVTQAYINEPCCTQRFTLAHQSEPEMPSASSFFIVGLLSHPFSRASLRLIRQSLSCSCFYLFCSSILSYEFSRAPTDEPELPSAIKDFLKYNSYQIEYFLKQWICIEHSLWIPIQWTVSFRE